MLVFTKYQSMYFHALTEMWPTSYFMHTWSWQSTPGMYLLYSWMFCGWFTWITLWPSLLSVWITFLGFEFILTSLTILLSCQTIATKFELPSCYDLLALQIILPGLPIPSKRYFLFTCIVSLQYVLWASKSFSNWTVVNRLSQDMMIFS